MSIPTQQKRNPVDDESQDNLSEDVEQTPTDKSGDETQRNQQIFTEDGIEGRSKKRPDHRERSDAP